MLISLMFLTGVLARVAVSNAMKAASAAVAWALPKWAKVHPESHHKSRHPYQMLRSKDLELGREYTTVYVRECDGRMFEYRRTFAGAFSRKPKECELPRKSGKHHYSDMTFTVHLDGWTPWDFTMDTPSYVIWGGDGNPCTNGSVAHLLGEDWLSSAGKGQHELLVPTDRWNSDPHVVVDWTEKRPCGELGEMVWMYDTLDHRQIAAVISGRSLHAPDDVYYVTFIRDREFSMGWCNLQSRSKLTMRQDSERVDEFWQKHTARG